MLGWRWERLRRAVLDLVRTGTVRKIPGHGRSVGLFAMTKKRWRGLDRLAREQLVKPGLLDLLGALDGAQQKGQVITQYEWLQLGKGRPGWSRRNFQRRVRRLVELGIVEPHRDNDKRHRVYYFVRIRMKGKRSRPPLAHEEKRRERFERDVWKTLLPRGLDYHEREARELSVQQGKALDPPFRPVSDARRVLDVDEGTWLVIGESLIHFSHEELVELHSILEGAPGPRLMLRRAAVGT